MIQQTNKVIWAPSSKFVSSSIPSWQISTAHAQPFRGARDLASCLKVPLDSLLVWAWTFTARIGDKYQIRLTGLIYTIGTRWFSEAQIGAHQILLFCDCRLLSKISLVVVLNQMLSDSV